VKEKRG